LRTRIILIGGLVILTAAAVVALAGNPGSGSKDGKVDKVVTGFYPLAFAAQEVGGPGLDVENLTPPGAEPHDLEVSPHDVRDLESADLVVLMGRGFQPQLERAARNGGARLIEILDTPGLGVNGADPHVWLDPLRYARVVETIAAALGRRGAARPLVERLHGLDRVYRSGLASCKRHSIVTSHEAFAYLAGRYGLRQIPITGLSPEAEPSPADLNAAIERVRQSGATTVFTETLLSPKLAQTVARETGAMTTVLNPIEGLTPAERDRGDDYFTLMRANLAKLRAALACR
jgi:zinc transport system substrate-binding protein